MGVLEDSLLLLSGNTFDIRAINLPVLVKHDHPKLKHGSIVRYTAQKYQSPHVHTQLLPAADRDTSNNKQKMALVLRS